MSHLVLVSDNAGNDLEGIADYICGQVASIIAI